jgi:hypothetical protein
MRIRALEPMRGRVRASKFCDSVPKARVISNCMISPYHRVDTIFERQDA